jgi:hypothetical protein
LVLRYTLGLTVKHLRIACARLPFHIVIVVSAIILSVYPVHKIMGLHLLMVVICYYLRLTHVPTPADLILIGVRALRTLVENSGSVAVAASATRLLQNGLWLLTELTGRRMTCAHAVRIRVGVRDTAAHVVVVLGVWLADGQLRCICGQCGHLFATFGHCG